MAFYTLLSSFLHFSVLLFGSNYRILYICIIQKRKNKEIMKAITTTKYNRVENTDTEFLNNGIVAFQLVKFTINFYGNEIETTHDTKIMKDGRQFVIGGCGYIKEGYELN